MYCIIESDAPRSFGQIGIGGRGDEVYTIHRGGLAAVVSDTPVVVYDPTRQNALTHNDVTQTVMKDFTVVPMSFGTIFNTEADVVEFLKDTADALHDVLENIEGKNEWGLKVYWEPQTVLQVVGEEHEDIRRLTEEIKSNRLASTYFARMELGRLIERAMSEKSDAYVREIYDHLHDCAVASKHSKTIGDKMILNAVFLVNRDQEDEFTTKVQDLQRKNEGTLRIEQTGPWAAYNFVNIRLKLERAGATV